MSEHGRDDRKTFFLKTEILCIHSKPFVPKPVQPRLPTKEYCLVAVEHKKRRCAVNGFIRHTLSFICNRIF